MPIICSTTYGNLMTVIFRKNVWEIYSTLLVKWSKIIRAYDIVWIFVFLSFYSYPCKEIHVPSIPHVRISDRNWCCNFLHILFREVALFQEFPINIYFRTDNHCSLSTIPFRTRTMVICQRVKSWWKIAVWLTRLVLSENKENLSEVTVRGSRVRSTNVQLSCQVCSWETDSRAKHDYRVERSNAIAWLSLYPWE